MLKTMRSLNADLDSLKVDNAKLTNARLEQEEINYLIPKSIKYKATLKIMVIIHVVSKKGRREKQKFLAVKKLQIICIPHMRSQNIVMILSIRNKKGNH